MSPLPEPPPGPRSALVVAVSSHEDQGLARLRAPAADSVALAEVLGDPDIGGFEVETLADPSAHDIRLGVEDFLHGRKADELLFVYFSCHGLLDARGRLYFAGADTRKDRLASSGVEAGWLLELLDECRARRQVVVLDCCFSGAFAHGAKAGERDVDLGHRLVGHHGRGRAVLTASRSREYSFEGESLTGAAAPSGSVFTTGLVDGLRTGAADTDGDGYISVEDAFDHAAAYVAEHGTDQTPQRWIYGAEGRIWLARTAVPAAVDADLPEAVRVALASPLPAVRTGGVMALGEWLSDGDEEQAQLARRHLERVAGTEDPKVARVARDLLAPPGPALPAVPAPAAEAAEAPPVPKSLAPTASRHAPAALPGLLHALPVWYLAGGSEQRLTALALHPTAALVVLSVDGGPPQVWDPAERRLLHVLHSPDDGVGTLAFSADGSALITVAHDSTIRVWDVGHWSWVSSVPAHDGAPVELLAVARNSRLLATSTADGSVRIWAPPHKKPLHRFPPDGGRVTALAFSPDQFVLAAGSRRGRVRMYDPSAVELLWRARPYGGAVTGLVFSRDGRRLAGSGGKEGSVTLWTTGKWDTPQDHRVGEDPVRHIAFSPDGQLLAASTGPEIHLFATGPGRRLATLGGAGSSEMFAFSHDGELLATGDHAGAVWLWHRRTGQRRHQFVGGHTATPAHLGFTPDDRFLVTGGDDGVYVWQLR